MAYAAIEIIPISCLENRVVLLEIAGEPSPWFLDWNGDGALDQLVRENVTDRIGAFGLESVLVRPASWRVEQNTHVIISYLALIPPNRSLNAFQERGMITVRDIADRNGAGPEEKGARLREIVAVGLDHMTWLLLSKDASFLQVLQDAPSLWGPIVSMLEDRQVSGVAGCLCMMPAAKCCTAS